MVIGLQWPAHSGFCFLGIMGAVLLLREVEGYYDEAEVVVVDEPCSGASWPRDTLILTAMFEFENDDELSKLSRFQQKERTSNQSCKT